METVFDHNITSEECEAIGIGDKDSFLAIASANSNNFELALLFHLRGDDSAVQRYLNRLPREMVTDFWRTVGHP
ncbi:MAG: hypothetical protein K2G35_04205 [Duncaniella sp.]|nr:hypothetical protein [Duncaniella sp.]